MTMTKEQIEQAAKEFAVERHGEHEAWAPDRYESAIAFLAGANSRQPEIDALTADNERLQKEAARLKDEKIIRFQSQTSKCC